MKQFFKTLIGLTTLMMVIFAITGLPIFPHQWPFILDVLVVVGAGFITGMKYRGSDVQTIE